MALALFAQLRSLAWIIGGFALAVLIIAWQVERRGHAKSKARIVELVELRKSDRQSYEAAQAKAKADNIAHVAEIEEQYEIISNRISSDYARDLERLRGAAKANRGSAGGAKAPGVPQAPGGADADGLPDIACDHLCAQEIELRLMYLQRWVADQAGVSR